MEELLNQIMQAGDGRVMITVRADDLRKFAEYVAESVGRRYAETIVAEIKEVMGDKMKYCTTQEVKEILGIKSSATLPSWAKRGYLVPCRVGIRNIYLREEVLALKNARAKW